MLLYVFTVTVVIFTCSVELEDLQNEISDNFDWTLLKDYLKFHVYVNPHPICALEDELCSLDNNCCRGLECNMAVDKEGLKYTCQPKVGRNATENSTEGEVTDEEDVHWGFDDEDKTSQDAETILKEINRNRLGKAKRKEERLLNDPLYLIKELQEPLTLEEMRELQVAKELEDYKRERELKELREWEKNKNLEENKKEEYKKTLENIAKERVEKVLNEEEKQKKEMLKNVQESMKNNVLG